MTKILSAALAMLFSLQGSITILPFPDSSKIILSVVTSVVISGISVYLGGPVVAALTASKPTGSGE